jgi:hypothetical protein
VSGLGRGTVLDRIANGDLKTITMGADLRIPVSELRRICEEILELEEGIRMRLAMALQAGLIKEVGVDEDGYVVYERR